MAQINVLVGFDLPTHMALEEYCEKTNRKRAEVVREATRIYISLPENENKKKIPIRMENAMHIFRILKFMTKSDGSTRKEYFLDFNDVLINKYGRWGVAKSAVTIFGNICSQLRHSVIVEERIIPITVPGAQRSRLSKEGFTLYFEKEITFDDIESMEIKAREMVSQADFVDKVTLASAEYVTQTNENYVNDVVNQLSAGKAVMEKFETDDKPLEE